MLMSNPLEHLLLNMQRMEIAGEPVRRNRCAQLPRNNFEGRGGMDDFAEQFS